MARPKEFDRGEALDAAIRVFGEHGFEGASTDMLVQAMGIGRQSLYDTFGDKWQLYSSSLERYAATETSAHAAALRSKPRAIDGIKAMVSRVVDEARQPCLGVGSLCEFGRARPELTAIHGGAERVLRDSISRRVREAQADGDVTSDLGPGEVADFLTASFASIRIAARGGAAEQALKSLGRMALRALQ